MAKTISKHRLASVKAARVRSRPVPLPACPVTRTIDISGPDGQPNVTLRALHTMINAGRHGREALGHLCDLYDDRDFSGINRIAGCTRGATAVEYALIAALVSVVSIVALGQLGNTVANVISIVADKLS
jgi:Flp pilus assembly pilin Flp